MRSSPTSTTRFPRSRGKREPGSCRGEGGRALRLRVVTYNIHGFHDGFGGVVESILDLAPDVLLVQEAGSRHRLRRLAAAAGLSASVDPPSPFRRRVKNAVLVRRPWRIVGHRLHRFRGSSRLYPRGALVAEARSGRQRMWTISIHLGLSPVERASHVRELTELCTALPPAPIVVGGDLNASPGEPAPAWLAARFRDAWTTVGVGDGATFPSWSPAARIDYVFATRDLASESAFVGRSLASDHLPLAVEITLEG